MKATFTKFGYDIHQLQNENAKETEILKLLDDLYDYLKKYKGRLSNEDGSKKVIVFAFAGHGKEEESDKDSMAMVTYDNKYLSLKTHIMGRVGVGLTSVYKIPKLFFIDACRGPKTVAIKGTRGFMENEGNYRIDFATIPDHVSYESKWMPELAEKLREMMKESLQNVIAYVSKEIQRQNERDQSCIQLCESRDRLVTGPLYLHP